MSIAIRSENIMKENKKDKDIHQQKSTEQPSGKKLEAGESASIPVIEEQLKVGKEVVETGKVHISKKVHEEEQMIDLPGSRDELDVERVTINKYVDAAPPAVRHEGDKMIIPVLREVAVVEKRLVLVEELHVTRRQVKTEDRQSVTLRKEEVNVDRKKSDKLDRS